MVNANEREETLGWLDISLIMSEQLPDDIGDPHVLFCSEVEGIAREAKVGREFCKSLVRGIKEDAFMQGPCRPDDDGKVYLASVVYDYFKGLDGTSPEFTSVIHHQNMLNSPRHLARSILLMEGITWGIKDIELQASQNLTKGLQTISNMAIRIDEWLGKGATDQLINNDDTIDFIVRDTKKNSKSAGIGEYRIDSSTVLCVLGAVAAYCNDNGLRVEHVGGHHKAFQHHG